tara:strand:+ start:776 stop:1051 length:276 start_codon:yes stop_codon:yes gene_type:complete
VVTVNHHLPEILLLDQVVVVMIAHVVKFVPPAMVRLFAQNVHWDLAMKRVVQKKRERAENLLIVGRDDGQEILRLGVDVKVRQSTTILMGV